MKPGFDYTGLLAVFMCHDGQGKFLMSKRGLKARDEHGTWEFGGGSIEFGESPEEAVRRELFEEYGCKTIYDIKQLSTFNLLRNQDNQQTHWVGFPFLIQINPSEVKINEAESIDAIDWFGFNHLPEPLHPGEKYVIESYKAYLATVVN